MSNENKLEAQRPAIEAACRFIEEHVSRRECDSDGARSCWRCNSVYLAKMMRHALAAQAAPQPVTGITVERVQKWAEAFSDAWSASFAYGIPGTSGVEQVAKLNAIATALSDLRAAIAEHAEPSQDAKDAARYRWLRDRLAIEDIERLQIEFFGTPDEAESQKTDAAIDAGMAAEGAKRG